MSNLETIRDRVEHVLADTTNATWSTDDVDEAIRQALDEYSTALPRQVETTLTLTSAGREIDVSSISGLVDVVEVWIDYDASNPSYPEPIRPFRFWKDSSLVYILGQYEPQSGDVARVFYTMRHTIEDLDAASSTTLPAEHDTMLVQGAAGLAALSRALDLAEQITVDRETVQHLVRWGKEKVTEFRAKLYNAAIERQGVGHVPLPHIDRHDGMWA